MREIAVNCSYKMATSSEHVHSNVYALASAMEQCKQLFAAVQLVRAQGISAGSEFLSSFIEKATHLVATIKPLEGFEKLQLLRKPLISLYNECRAMQPSAAADAGLRMRVLELRLLVCLMIASLYLRGGGGGGGGATEACHVLARTGVAWAALCEDAAVRADPAALAAARAKTDQAYDTALQLFEGLGGMPGVSKHMVGADLESFTQMMYGCVMGKAAVQWQLVTEAATDATRTVELWASLSKLLLSDALALLKHLPSQRLPLAQLLADRAQWWLSKPTEMHVARRWLQAALDCCTLSAGREGQAEAGTKDAAAGVKLTQQLLCALATATVEELHAAKCAGQLQGADDTTASGLTLSTAGSKVIGYLSAAGQEDSVVGQHALMKLACCEGNMEAATVRLQRLLTLATVPPGTDAVAPVLPLGAAPSTISINAQFPLVASALRAFGVARSFDRAALDMYGTAIKSYTAQNAVEVVLLRHDLLTVIIHVVAERHASSAASAAAPLPMHELAAEKRVKFLLTKLVEDLVNFGGRFPLHIVDALYKTLKQAVKCAFEASCWSQCTELAGRLLLLVGTQRYSELQVDAAARNTEVTYLHKLIAHCCLLDANIAEALQHAREAVRCADDAGTRLLLFKVLARGPAPDCLPTTMPDMEAVARKDALPALFPVSTEDYCAALAAAFAALLDARDYQPACLSVAIEDLLSDGMGTAESYASKLSAPPAKLIVAAWAIRKLLESDATGAQLPVAAPSAHPRAKELVCWLMSIYDKLFSYVNREQPETGMVLSPAAAAHHTTVLRLLYAAVRYSRVGGPRLLQPQSSADKLQSDEQCLRYSWNTMLMFTRAGQPLKVIAAAAAVDTFASAVAGLAGGSGASGASDAAVARTPEQQSRCNVLLLVSLCASRMLQASSHMKLAQAGTTTGSTPEADGSSNVLSTQSLPWLDGAVSLAYDPLSRVQKMSHQEHVAAAAQHVSACHDLASQLQQAAVRASSSCGADFTPLSIAAAAVAEKASSELLLQGLSASALQLVATLVSQVAAPGAAAALGAASKGDRNAASQWATWHDVANRMAALVILLELSVQCAQAVALPSTSSRSEALTKLVQRLRECPGVTAFMLEQAANMLRMPPVSDLTLSMKTLIAAVETELAQQSRGAGADSRDVRYAASLLRTLLRIVPSRAEALPLLDRVQSFVKAECAVMTPASGSPLAVERMLQPVSELADFAICLSWNHGVYFVRLHALERAEQFMTWSMDMLGVVEQLSSARAGHTGPSGWLPGVCSDLVCLQEAASMRQQYQLLQASLQEHESRYGITGARSFGLSSGSGATMPGLGQVLLPAAAPAPAPVPSGPAPAATTLAASATSAVPVDTSAPHDAAGQKRKADDASRTPASDESSSAAALQPVEAGTESARKRRRTEADADASMAATDDSSMAQPDANMILNATSLAIQPLAEPVAASGEVQAAAATATGTAAASDVLLNDSEFAALEEAYHVQLNGRTSATTSTTTATASAAPLAIADISDISMSDV